MEDPKREEVLRELTESWARAQEQFRELRAAVEEAARLSELKERGDAIARARDVALRALGEALYGEVLRGGLALPKTLQTAWKGVQAVEQQRQAHAAEISALLAEGHAAADRLAAPPAKPPAKPSLKPKAGESPLARGHKKR